MVARRWEEEIQNGLDPRQNLGYTESRRRYGDIC